MNRLQVTAPRDADGALADLYTSIKRSLGKVPNVYQALGSNAPAALQLILELNGALQTRGILTRREIEAINLAVSENSGCDYCVAAHTLAGKSAGFSAEQMHRLRDGHYPEDARLDALVRFARAVVNGRGTLQDTAFDDLRRHGFTDAQVVEAIGAMAAILFTNMLNRVNDTELDFPTPA